MSLRWCLLFLACLGSAGAQTNPLFNGGDPWITYDDGMYYYSASYCGLATICVKASSTIEGIAAAPWYGVWTASPGRSNSQEVWAPEIHKVAGKWYIYYAADDGNNSNHRIFILQSENNNPVGFYVPADTGGPNGQLMESRGAWAIDPDVFTAADGYLYAVWSCTNLHDASFPQSTCIAPMRDATHVAGESVQISTPTESWEMRTSPIQEGPVGYTRNRRTYITYSASASWTANDYAVGLLTNADGRLLNPGSWLKTGPVFDHHGAAYGTGSVVFIASPDGSEWWNFYHGIDQLTCSPSYNCRDIRMQRMSWAADGTPLLGYPLSPGVPVDAGVLGAATWGDAFGDAAEGNPGAGAASGAWTVGGDGSVRNGELGSSWSRTFLAVNPNLEDYLFAVEAQLLETGHTSTYPKYGVYAAYSDSGNYASVWIDAGNKILATYGKINGAIVDWANCPLPEGIDPSAWNRLEVRKTGSKFAISMGGVHLAGACNDRTFNLLNGQPGLVTEDALAAYRGVVFQPGNPAFTNDAVVNAASFIHGGVAAGELVSIFGTGLGPLDPVWGQFVGTPLALPTNLAGVQVRFDGVAAPLLYVSNGQINVQAPYGIAGKQKTMVLIQNGALASNWIPVDVAAADPGIFDVINNDDGSVNSADHPAKRGRALIVYGTGQGPVEPPVPAGQPSPSDPPATVQGVTAKLGDADAPVLFGGLAPSYVGLLQVNIEVPGSAAAGGQELTLNIGSASTQTRVWIE